MAKEQNLSLNPTKISGICGRLMCCLNYEQSTYEDIRKRLPRVGSIVETPEGQGEVVGNSTVKEMVKVKMKNAYDEEVILPINIKDIKLITGGYEDNINDSELKNEVDIIDKTVVNDLLKE